MNSAYRACGSRYLAHDLPRRRIYSDSTFDHLAIFNFAVRIRDHLQKFHDVGVGKGSQYANFPDRSDGEPALRRAGDETENTSIGTKTIMSL